MPKNIKNLIVVIFIMILAVLFIYFWAKNIFQQNTPNNNQIITNSENLNQVSAISIKTITEETKDYTINAAYPEVSLADTVKMKKINQDIKTITINEINDFKGGVQDNLDSGEADMKNSFDESYNVDYFDEKLLSIDFSFDTYFSGAAHPNQYSAVFNYDLKTNQEIKLVDLFIKDCNFLNILSEKATVDLSKNLKEDFINNGASPKEENFQNFIFTNEGLVILFDPYQVAPYVAGSQTVLIGYDSLKEIINPDGPINYLIQNK